MSGESIDQSIFAVCSGCKQIVWASVRDFMQKRDHDKIVELVLNGYTIETRPTPRRAPEIGCRCQAEFDF